MSPIQILMSSNEKGSARAAALAKVAGADPAYELQGFKELPVDMRMRVEKPCPTCREAEWEGMNEPCPECGDRGSVKRCVYIELKELDDFWASKATGHLGSQLLAMIAEGQPAFVAVFGSLQETLAQVPKVKNQDGKVKSRTQMDIVSDINTARAFCADACACNVPVFFLDSDHEMSFKWILSYAKNILTGPYLSSWLPKFDVNPIGYSVLCSIPGIGDAAARGLLKTYGSPAQIANEAKHNPGALAACRIGGRALGPAKARKIVEVFG